MSVLYIMLPAALVIAGAAAFMFVRAVMSGQYDDCETPAWRVVLDDDLSAPSAPAIGESAEQQRTPGDLRSLPSSVDQVGGSGGR